MSNILRFIAIMLLTMLLLFASVSLLLWISGGDRAPPERQKVVGRRVFSPDIRHDPYVQKQWEESVRALEEECRRARRFCIEAKNAREAMDNLD